jgi:putative resolvase
MKVKASEAAEFYGISLRSLRRLAHNGQIEVTQTPGGHYLYEIPSDKEGEKRDNSSPFNFIIYSRVSSRKQEGDLKHQTDFLKEKYPTYTSIKDIGSGINYNRPGFKSILEQLYKGNVKKVVVAHSDRFSRLGFEFFQWMFEQFGAVLESDDKSTTEDDMVGDIMEIFTVFTARYYGQRKYSDKDKEDGEKPKKNRSKKSKDLSESTTKTTI